MPCQTVLAARAQKQVASFPLKNSEKSVSNPSVGTRLLVGHSESISGITAFSQSASPNAAHRKRNSRAEGARCDEGGQWLRVTFGCKAEMEGRQSERGRSDQMKVCGGDSH